MTKEELKPLLMTIRRALLMVVSEIEKMYNQDSTGHTSSLTQVTKKD